MKAMLHKRYGPPEVLELAELDRPAPREDEVLVRVHAASINEWDWGRLFIVIVVLPASFADC